MPTQMIQGALGGEGGLDEGTDFQFVTVERDNIGEAVESRPNW